MNDVIVFKASDNMENRIALADVGKKLVAQTFAFGRALDKPCDIGKIDGGADDARALRYLCELVQARVCDLDNGRIRLNRAKRIILRRRLLFFRKRIKKCRLAHVGKPNYTYRKTHFFSSLSLFSALPLNSQSG